MKQRTRALLIVTTTLLVLSVFAVVSLHYESRPDAEDCEQLVADLTPHLATFERFLQDFQRANGIPGMAAGIVHDGRLICARGFGFADLDRQIPATPETPFHLDALTRPFSATLVLHLMEQGRIQLDDPLANYGVASGTGGDCTVRQLLADIWQRPAPNGADRAQDRFATLGAVLRQATGKPFRDLLLERIIFPIGLEDSSPGNQRDGDAGVLSRLARPYRVGDLRQPLAGSYGEYFGTDSGLVSSVRDLARFDIALTQGSLLDSDSRELAFTPTSAPTPDPAGQPSFSGLGWFVQDVAGERLIWHHGQGACSSSLILKIPARRLTFIVLANTRHLTHTATLERGDITRSPVAMAFLENFVRVPG